VCFNCCGRRGGCSRPVHRRLASLLQSQAHQAASVEGAGAGVELAGLLCGVLVLPQLEQQPCLFGFQPCSLLLMCRMLASGVSESATSGYLTA
jgi:hypothetical protein